MVHVTKQLVVAGIEPMSFLLGGFMIYDFLLVQPIITKHCRSVVEFFSRSWQSDVKKDY